MSVVTINCVVFACALMPWQPWQTQTMQGTDINKVTRSSPAPSNFHAVHAPCARQVMRRAPRPPLSKTTISDNSAMPRLMVSHGSCFRPEKNRTLRRVFFPTHFVHLQGGAMSLSLQPQRLTRLSLSYQYSLNSCDHRRKCSCCQSKGNVSKM